METFSITGKNLTLEVFEQIVIGHRKISLAASAARHMNQSLRLLRQWVRDGKTIYGVNTGFGALSDERISPAQQDQLQLNLVRSHCTGVGSLFSEEETRAIMLLRAHVLARGYSGVRTDIVTMLLGFLNQNLIPAIPKKGSVGASGDLAPLAHLALTLIGEGEIVRKSKIFSAKAAFAKMNLKPLRLTGREGIALVNGTQVMTALSALNIIRAERLMKLFDVAAALSLEAMQGSKKPFDVDIHTLRPHAGQKIVAQNIRKLLQKSDIQKNHRRCKKIQDAYSIRCIPQVHGSSKEAHTFAKKIILTELNSVTDNPILFSQKQKWVSGGNFHGQFLAQAMDFLAIALTTLVNISERRIEKLLDPRFSELPPFLTRKSGLSSGLMLAHVTAAALASENKVLSHPASTDTIPTSGNKEDHVSMGAHAALKATEIIHNAEDVLAIEFLAASQGIEFLRPLRTSEILEKTVSVIRKRVPPISNDRPFSKDIHRVKEAFPEILKIIKGIIQ